MMRIIFIILLILNHLQPYSQVSDYDFSVSYGTYNEVIGGTQVIPGVQDNYVGNFSMPFPFYFGCDLVNEIYVSSNGFISFNSVSSAPYTPFQFNNTANSVSFFARDGKTDNEGVNYIVQGSAPNRVCIIDFHEWHWSGGLTDEMSAQIKLFESSNVIEIVYGICTAYNIIPGTSIGGAVGIGNSYSAMVTYNNPTMDGCWDLSTTISAPSQTTYLQYGNQPCQGQILRWDPGQSIPNNPGQLSSNSPGCNSVQINRIGNPPNGVQWFWQDINPSGTSTSYGNDVSYIAFNSGTYFLRARSDIGCWSPLSSAISVDVFNATSGVDIQSACDSYTWIDGNTYTASNNSATYILPSSVGCDSVITLNLTINSNNSTDFQSACDSYTWIDGITYTSNNNSATHVLTNTAGCDSVVTLNLTLFNSNQTFDEHVACDVFTWIDGNTYTQSTNSPNIIYVNQNGCDSTVFLDLTINESIESLDVHQACGAFTWIDGNVYTEDNYNASVLLQSSNGCDSVVNLNLTFVNEFNTIDEQLACESYTWINGTTYYQSTNTESIVLSSEYGCDSLVTLDLSIGYPEDTILYISSFGDYEMNGITYTESGTYEQVLQNQYGCDSTVILNLNIDDSGVEDFSEYGISVYPNPFSSVLHVELEHLIPNAKMILTDVHGKVLWQRNVLELQNVIDLEYLNKGMYYLSIFYSDKPIGQLKVIRR